jgi:ribokinase
MRKILVIGSSNTDLIAKVKKFPAAGETIEGISFLQAMGGKGANQAMAAHRLGGNVNFITCLGNDLYGKNSLKYYKKEGLQTEGSLIIQNEISGTALILVNKFGENLIVITPGANKLLTPEHITNVSKIIDKADIILLQMEIPYETILHICEIAKKKKKKIILNAAPARKLSTGLISKIDILVVNETEAETITNRKIADDGLNVIINSLIDLGVNTVILTLGEDGCILKNKEVQISLPAFKVDVKDTTGAGDTFCGALAVGLSNGSELAMTLEFATAASAICVTRMGAQPSIPNEKEVNSFLKDNIQSLRNKTFSKKNNIINS